MRYDTLRTAYVETLETAARSQRGLGPGFDDWSTHCLRHTFATNLRRGGADPMTILEFGGWGDLPTAKRYIKEDPDNLGVAYFNAHERLEALKAEAGRKTTYTLAERLALRRARESASAKDSQKVVHEDCV